MADVINLRQKRKSINRTEKEKVAEANRAKFGRTKQEKQLEKKARKMADKHLEDHKLDPEN
jgi:hypothetical protein